MGEERFKGEVVFGEALTEVVFDGCSVGAFQGDIPSVSAFL